MRTGSGWLGYKSEPARVTQVAPRFIEVIHNDRLKTSGRNKTRKILRDGDHAGKAMSGSTEDGSTGVQTLCNIIAPEDSSSYDTETDDEVAGPPDNPAPLEQGHETPLQPSTFETPIIDNPVTNEITPSQSSSPITTTAQSTPGNQPQQTSERTLPRPRRSRHGVRDSEVKELLRKAGSLLEDRSRERRAATSVEQPNRLSLILIPRSSNSRHICFYLRRGRDNTTADPSQPAQHRPPAGALGQSPPSSSAFSTPAPVRSFA